MIVGIPNRILSCDNSKLLPANFNKEDSRGCVARILNLLAAFKCKVLFLSGTPEIPQIDSSSVS
ncbi:hypothetical protein LEP1GSC060_2312 [Leptospira weilii serovar Ranarum str. ICFT]|uniref:Uncharacterized protein n=1 Tax=Leptospira weilii serovar Ranarum str. ICFT TaxID=1218598 RepID=N1WH28_9LEPT|nr:hypothetical protein LEP1GSC060_2312 [Leptospira weilii serovar Ranarum str. ICFT]